ncbi:MAG TPA: 2-C-methyl-D-erythritol 4-phosphate cytidylyltransferase [Coriobacteriia bacterium]
MSGPRTAAVIVAGGTGERLGRPGGKQLALVLGKPVLSWTLAAFDAAPEVELIVVVCHPDRTAEYRATAVDPIAPATPIVFAPSGETRQASVASGLVLVPERVTTVLVHDGARPLVTPTLIGAALAALGAEPDADGIVVGHPAVDTLKVVIGQTVAETPERARFWAVQTPQIFRAASLRAAYRVAGAEGFLGTDDSSLVERNGGRVVVFEGPRDNIKVTVAEDLVLVEAALRFRGSGGQA